MPTAGPGRNADLVVDVPVRDEPIGVERAPLRGRAHAAIRLGQMAAIVEAALVEEAAELGKTGGEQLRVDADRKSTRLNSSHSQISYAVFCLKKKKRQTDT